MNKQMQPYVLELEMRKVQRKAPAERVDFEQIIDERDMQVWYCVYLIMIY